MLRSTARLYSTSVRTLAEQAAAAGTAAELKFTLSLPHAPLLDHADVKRVTLPGRAGVFGVEIKSPPMLSELRPGLIHVLHADDKEDRYYIPGGFAFVNPDNTCSVSTPEGIRLEDVDADRLREGIHAATHKRDTSQNGSREHSEALISLEVLGGLAKHLGVST